MAERSLVGTSNGSNATPRLLEMAEAGDPAALEFPLAGDPAPEVVLLQSGDYRCPFTRRAEEELVRLMQDRKVQRYFLAAPRSADSGAYVLAVAAAAAQRQGRFWELHPLLLHLAPDAGEDLLLQAAREVGLDIPTFIRDLQRPELKAHVERQRVLAAALGLASTPSFLVNGRLVVGWPGAKVMGQLLDEEAAVVAERTAGGQDRTDVVREQARRHPPLAVVMEQGIRFGDPPEHRRDPVDEDTRWRVPLAPAAGELGNRSSPLVVVEYLDPACSHSAKAYRQARALAAERTNLRFVFKLAPRRSEPESLRRARLAWSATERGAFFDCADALFSAEVTEETSVAACLGTPPVAAQDDARFVSWLQNARVEALAVAAAGTPTVFVNGRRLVGVQKDAELDRILHSEAGLARTLETRGIAADKVYTWLTAYGRVESFLSPEIRPAQCVECPVLADGGKGAREMLVAFDYGSPFCRNLVPHLSALLSSPDPAGPVTVRILPWVLGDPESRAASVTALCVAQLAQPSFPRFHAELVRLKQENREEDLTELLGTIGLTRLDLECLVSQGTARLVQALADHADHLSVTGTPVIFVDGREVTSQTGIDQDVLRAALRQASAAAGTTSNADSGR